MVTVQRLGRGVLLWSVKNDSESALGVRGVVVNKRVRTPELRHQHNTSPKRSIAAESSVHEVPRDTAMPDADDFALPALEPSPSLVLEFDVVLVPVPGSELLPETVSWPEISEKKKKRISMST